MNESRSFKVGTNPCSARAFDIKASRDFTAILSVIVPDILHGFRQGTLSRTGCVSRPAPCLVFVIFNLWSLHRFHWVDCCRGRLRCGRYAAEMTSDGVVSSAAQRDRNAPSDISITAPFSAREMVAGDTPVLVSSSRNDRLKRFLIHLSLNPISDAAA